MAKIDDASRWRRRAVGGLSDGRNADPTSAEERRPPFEEEIAELRATRRAKLTRANELIGPEGGKAKTRWGWVIVSRATRWDRKGEWQATEFDRYGEPTGHTNYKTLRPVLGDDDVGPYPTSAVAYVASVLDETPRANPIGFLPWIGSWRRGQDALAREAEPTRRAPSRGRRDTAPRADPDAVAALVSLGLTKTSARIEALRHAGAGGAPAIVRAVVKARRANPRRRRGPR